MSTANQRLAVVLTHPTQYYSPWFRSVSSQGGVTLRVFYLWDFGVTHQTDPNFGKTIKWDVDLLSGYDHEFVPNLSKSPGAQSFFGFSNPGLTNRIADWNPDAVLLFGYKWSSHIKVALWAWRTGIPVIFRGDSHLIGRGSPGLFTKALLGLLFSRFAAFLYVGAANRAYFKAFGVSDRKLFFAPHSVDATLFNPSKPDVAANALRQREQLGLTSGTVVVLYSGKLVAAKQPVELLEAFAKLDRKNTALVFVGDGPERETLERMVAVRSRQPQNSSVHLLPFSNQSEMPARYALCDIFVLPSRGLYETWGLAVNEAMHMGVPCLVSDRVGCQMDLVSDGKTGWVFSADDSDGLRRALSTSLGDMDEPGRREQIRGAVESRIRGYDYLATTKGLLAALESLPSAAMRSSPPTV
ncbi:MAG TPA: glycosyltransferase family 4 protein [Opitutaceae bacterium]|jgi:glycosyltransferase involved in cell wall biosynthesis|nr:glycosyltransferase family 4 protein [Opitutaceae bacterium]